MDNDSWSYNSSKYSNEARSLRNLFESELSLELIAQKVKQDLAEKEKAQQQVAELKQQVVELKQVAELKQEITELKQVAELKQQVAERNQQVVELKQQLEETSALLNEMELEAKVSSEEAELTLLQLHQVQKELENFFFQSRGKDDLIQKYQAQQQRMQKLVSKVFSHM